MFIYIATTLPPQQTYRTHSPTTPITPSLDHKKAESNDCFRNSAYFENIFAYLDLC